LLSLTVRTVGSAVWSDHTNGITSV